MLSRRTALVGAMVALGSACLILVPRAGVARAAPVTLESYRTFGVARGAEFSFTFKGSLFEPLLHIGLPYARSGLKSEAGATGAAAAGQVYPGDLIASQAGDNFPGIASAAYPPGREHVKDVAPFPGAGPVTADAGRVRAEAAADHALGVVTTGGGGFANGDVPILSMGSSRVTSEASLTEDGVVQTVRSTVNGIELDLAEGFAIRIEQVVSTAEAVSDGVTSDAEARLTVAGVVVEMGGRTLEATIDDRGLHLSEPLQDVAGVPLDLEQSVQAGLRQLGVSISTAGPIRIVDGATAESSVGGLVIGLTGEIPIVPVPQAFAQLIGQVRGELPGQVSDPICFQDDVDPDFPVPLCVGINFLPGPGSGMVQTLSFGNVNAIVGASVAPDGDGGDDGVDDGDDGSSGFPPGPGGGPEPVPSAPGNGGGGNGGGGPAPAGLTGLLARMPPGVALGLGFGFFLAAALVSLTSPAPLRRSPPR